MKTRVKIEGGWPHLKITDIETGQEIRHTTSLVYKQEYGKPTHGVPECTIKIYGTELNTETDAEIITVCPQCQKENEDRFKEIKAKKLFEEGKILKEEYDKIAAKMKVPPEDYYK